MKHGKSALIFLFLSLFLITKLSAKETQMAKDTKAALSSYAGLPELQKRGFSLESLDKAENMEEVYDALLPYMIQDGAPLDNAISLYSVGFMILIISNSIITFILQMIMEQKRS